LQKDGEQITGTLGSPVGDLAVKEARVEGNELRFRVSVAMGGQSIDATVTATIEGNSIRGAITMGAMGSFEFTGSRPR
jgi:hypothetical protein